MKIVSQQMQYPEVCPSCAASISTQVAQHFVGDKLMWSRARLCDSCGLAEASDTDDEGMAYFRNVLITAESFGVDLDLGAERTSELRAALSGVHASSVDTSDAVCRALMEGRWRGTQPEAAWVVSALEAQGIRARVARRTGPVLN